MSEERNTPTILLVPGHWLGAWVWDDVVDHLSAMGCRARALTLPGLDGADPGRACRTLDDQAAAIEQAISDSRGPVILVAHSGANMPASLVLDRHPEQVRRMVWVDSGPAAPGAAFAPDFPEGTEGLALPPFEALKQQASLDGLSDEMLERFRARALPEPGPVLRQRVELTNEERYDIPTTFVCCSIPSAQVRELAKAGNLMFADVGNFANVEYVDLPTGHWPMWSCSAELARILATASAEC